MAEGADTSQERPVAAAGNDDRNAVDNGIIGETGGDVISGDITDPGSSGDEEVPDDPDVAPIQGGDVSETPAAHSGTRGGGTGADMGTGGEVGTTSTLQSGTGSGG